jgi:multidrug resistance efflux pump
MIRKYGLSAAAAVLLVLALLHMVRGQQRPSALESPVPPARSPFSHGVAGAGLVEAQTENISVGSYLPGVVTEVLVKVGDRVAKGQPLFRLDDRALKSELKTRQANLDQALAQLCRLQQMPRKEELPALEAKVSEARAYLAQQEDLSGRTRRLYTQRAVGAEELNRQGEATRMARERLRKAEADLTLMKAGAWEPDLQVARAAVEQAKGQLGQTRTELERLEVRALVAGQVLQVNVRPGEFVGAPAGYALIVLGSVQQLHVRVDIDEHDIPRFQPGTPARALLRGDPGREYPLRFVRVEPYVIPKKALTGDNTERVDTRVLQVIYAIDNGSDPLYVGQQMDVYIAARGTAETRRRP